jgi:hypothetical protein
MWIDECRYTLMMPPRKPREPSFGMRWNGNCAVSQYYPKNPQKKHKVKLSISKTQYNI